MSTIAIGQLRGTAKLTAKQDGSIWRELGAVLVHNDGRIIVRPCKDASEADKGDLFAVAGWCLTDNYHRRDGWDWHSDRSAWASDIYRREPMPPIQEVSEAQQQPRPIHQNQ